jgi:hypothetical protein
LRLLLDANLPVGFAALLTAHDVKSVHDRGWSNLDNGALLTLDQNIRYQQNMRERPIAVLVLGARSNRIQDLEPLVSTVLETLPKARPGEVPS